MSKIKVKANTFNKIAIEPEIELFVVIGDKEPNLPLNVYTAIKEKIKSALKIDDFNFYIISKDLENLQKNGIKIDSSSLIEALFPIVLNEMENISFEIKNHKLKRTKELFEERKLDDAKELFEEINQNELSKFEFDEYKLLEFKLSNNKRKFFRDYLALFSNDPIKTRELYFSYIKFLEDERDEREPFKLIEEFEKKYPISELSKEELSYYHYLKGRNYYARGEFLLSAKHLKLAKDSVGKNEKLLASIYNTATNIFTDNLFFDEALSLADRAYELREKLKLPEISDTISLIGGIYFKSANFKKAYEHYKRAKELQESGRIYNYLAKSSTMLGFTNKAKEYIEKSSGFEDKKGFLTLIKFLYLFKKEDYKKMNELYKETIVLPEIRKIYDKVVIGWSYALLAKASFIQKKYKDGVEYLYKAIDFFIEDRYILESFYISLYPYRYEIPNEFLVKFNNLIDNFELQDKFREYVQKHENLSKDYSKYFEIEQSKKNNLKDFYNRTKNINPNNYNSLAIKKLLESYSLI